MREIKFRAWSTKRKCYEYNVGVNDSKPVRYGYQWFSTDNDVYHGDLEQFTGLLDKNGKEIYEGDIVLLSGNIFEVVFNQKISIFCMMRGKPINVIRFFGEDVIDMVYVTGNIHENPYLIKE